MLLNYAEAKAELGSMTDTDWASTIGALRSRAGITGGLTAKPTVVDSYLLQTPAGMAWHTQLFISTCSWLSSRSL